jgi:hypothetical protein
LTPFSEGPVAKDGDKDPDYKSKTVSPSENKEGRAWAFYHGNPGIRRLCLELGLTGTQIERKTFDGTQGKALETARQVANKGICIDQAFLAADGLQPQDLAAFLAHSENQVFIMDLQVSDGDSHAIAFQVDAKGGSALLFDGGWETFPLASALEAMKHYHESIFMRTLGRAPALWPDGGAGARPRSPRLSP